MKIALVDDEDKMLDLLTSFISQYTEETGTQFTVSKFKSGLDFVSGYSADYDVVFMDIQMPFMNGMETAKTLRKLDKDVALVFVTNMGRFAVKGYEVNAFDFMVKPISYYNFKIKIGRILSYVSNKESKSICVKNSIGLEKIRISDICYVEVAGRYVNLHLKESVVEMHSSLKQIEELLKEEKFFRCDNSFLVNLAYVTKIGKIDAVVGGKLIPVSRARHKMFMDAFTIYLGQNING